MNDLEKMSDESRARKSKVPAWLQPFLPQTKDQAMDNDLDHASLYMGIPLQRRSLPTACCGYVASESLPYPVMWNPWNKAVQCHNCGAVYAPPSP